MRFPAWARWAITILAIVAIAWRVPVEESLATLKRIDPRWLWLAVAVAAMALAVRWIKWQRLLDAGNCATPTGASLRSLLGGYVLSLVTPGRVGELGRPLYLEERQRAGAFLLTLLDRGLDAWTVYTYAILSLVVLMFRPAGLFAAAVWLATLPLALGMPSLVAQAGRWRVWRGKFGQEVGEAAGSLGGIVTAPFALWALLGTTLDLLTFFCLVHALSPAPFKAALVAFPWLLIAGGAPISAGGLGPREGVAALIYARMGLQSAAAMEAAFLFFVISTVVPAAAGVLWNFARRKAQAPVVWPAVVPLTAPTEKN